MSSSFAAATAYRPRAPSNHLKEIIEDSLEELRRVWDDRFRDKYGPLPARVLTLLSQYLECGDPHYGFVRLRCVNPECRKKEERLVPFSCRARGLCPSCGQRRAIEWAERMVEEVLPLVPYRQLVFTIPVSLRKSFLFDRSLYGELCRAGGRGRNVADPAYWEAKFVSSFVVKEKRERRLAQSVMNLHQKRWIP